MYGGVGKHTMRKRQLRAFNGFSEEADQQKEIQKMANSKNWSVKCCKEFCEFLDLDNSGDKEELIQRAVGFLFKPYATNNTECEDGIPSHRAGKQVKTRVKKRVHSESESDSDSDASPPPKKKPKKKTKKVKAKKKEKKKEKKKSPKKQKSTAPTTSSSSASSSSVKKGTSSKSGKPKSAKFLYIADRKDAAKIDYPDLEGTQLAMRLIAEYKALDETKKASYEKQAAEEKKAWEEAAAMAAEFDDL
jgi:hypothetical protein